MAIDLEWIEHPIAHTAMTYVGLGAAAVATIAFLSLLVEALFNASGPAVGVSGVLFLGGFGLYLVVMNLVGVRARLLGAVLPWLGIVCGAAFLVAAGMVVVGIAAAVGLALVPAIPFYLAWSIWLGFRLRGNLPASVAA